MKTFIKMVGLTTVATLILAAYIFFTTVRVGMDRMTALKRIDHPMIKRDTVVSKGRNGWGTYSPSDVWMYIFKGDTLAEIKRFKTEELNQKER